jgi:hypothetical protein
MTNFTTKEIHDVLANYDFAGITSLVDIGGGHGKYVLISSSSCAVLNAVVIDANVCRVCRARAPRLLFSILRKYPNIKKGHLFDLPSVIKGVVVPDDLAERVEVHGGSFLDAETGIPTGADAYIMKHIIHDWDDEKVRKGTLAVLLHARARTYVSARSCIF